MPKENASRPGGVFLSIQRGQCYKFFREGHADRRQRKAAAQAFKTFGMVARDSACKSLATVPPATGSAGGRSCAARGPTLRVLAAAH